MGGEYYEREVSKAESGSGYSEETNKVLSSNTKLHKSNDPQRFQDQKLSCDHKHPIVFALDVTGSMGDWPKVIYDKLPMFYGQVMMQGYLSDPSISFCAIGDATCDQAPLQTTDFGQGLQLDQLLSKIFLEGGGGPGSEESYELSAYTYLKQVDLQNVEIPYFFVTGDEHYYSKIPKSIVNKIFGPNTQQENNVEADKIWKGLMEKYNVFHLHKAYGGGGNENDKIVKQWSTALGSDRILHMKTPKSCIDVILGVIALTSGARTMEEYVKDMKDRGQDEERMDEVKNALKTITPSFIQNKVVKFKVENDKKEEEKKGEILKKGEEEKKEKVGKVEDLEKEVLELFEKTYIKNDEFDTKLEKMKKLKKIIHDIPQEYFCPLTKDILIDPVMAQDGNTYERKAIEAWFSKHETSPITNSKIPNMLIPNNAIQKLIAGYLEKNKGLL